MVKARSQAHVNAEGARSVERGHADGLRGRDHSGVLRQTFGQQRGRAHLSHHVCATKQHRPSQSSVPSQQGRSPSLLLLALESVPRATLTPALLSRATGQNPDASFMLDEGLENEQGK